MLEGARSRLSFNRSRLPKRMLAGIAWIAGGCAVLAIIASLLMSSLSLGMCANQVIKEVVSPDGKRKVVLFRRDCGATTDFSTQASVLTVGTSLPNDGGNVFSADSNHGRAPSGRGGGPALAVSWVGPNELVIEHAAAARVFKAEPSIGETRVRFVLR